MQTHEQLARLEQYYLHAFLGYAIKHLRNIHEAEELAQEIACRALCAIRSGMIGEAVDFDAYLWRIARNTLVNMVRLRDRAPLSEEAMLGMASDEPTAEDALIRAEEQAELRLALSRLWGNYRRVIVCHYYEEMPVLDIAARLGLSVEMVKFYLRVGRQKLKEGLPMIGEKSINPKPLCVYRWGEWCKVDVWKLFSRKLPCQIAIICHDAPRTVTEIANETGTPAVYIEEEIELLLEGGVMLPVGRDKYRTNFHILKADTMVEVEKLFRALYASFVPSAIAAFSRYLPRLRESGVFAYEVPDARYHWLFAKQLRKWIGKSHPNEYPRILSCGSAAYVYAAETEKMRWGVGMSGREFEEGSVVPVDFVAFGDFHFQNELHSVEKCRYLLDIALGKSDGSEDALQTATLIEEGYLVRREGKLYCNIMQITPEVRAIFREINAELEEELRRLCGDMAEQMRRIVAATIPDQLKAYVDGYTDTWIGTFGNGYFYEALEHAGFIAVPDADDNTPVASFIYYK